MLENEKNIQQTTERLTENNASSQEIENKVNEAENKLSKLNEEIKEKEMLNIFKKYQVKNEFYDYLKFKTNNIENSRIEDTIKKIIKNEERIYNDIFEKYNDREKELISEQEEIIKTKDKVKESIKLFKNELEEKKNKLECIRKR